MAGDKRQRPGDDRPFMALVLWITGISEGTFTHNVNISWIRGLDRDAPLDESYVIEWRVQPKPKGGWPLYDGKVLEVSDDEAFLRRRLHEEEGKSLRAPATPSRSQDDVLSSPVFRNMLKEIVTSAVATNSGTKRKSDDNSAAHSSDENVHRVGQALCLSNTAYLLAKAAPSGPAMTMTLVRATFTKERLRKSSYAGQKRTLSNGDTVQKPSLKRFKKMQDIQDFVRTRFLYMSQSAFSQAVNACTGSNVDKAKTRELIDDSDSDDDVNN